MPIKQKFLEILREMVEYRCELCGLPEEKIGKLQAHRKLRGNKGGRYVPNNILMICSECHKQFHQGEFT